jgi:hypothetical protein
METIKPSRAAPPDGVCWQPARPPHRCALARLGSGARGRGESRPPGERPSRACGAGHAGRPQQQEGSQGAWSGSMVRGPVQVKGLVLSTRVFHLYRTGAAEL